MHDILVYGVLSILTPFG